MLPRSFAGPRNLPAAARAFLLPTVAVVLGLLGPTARAAICYAVYDANDAILYRAPQPPVDMSGNFADSVDKRWPRGKLIWFETDQCLPVLPTTLAEAAAFGGRVDPFRTLDAGARSDSVPLAPPTAEPKDGAAKDGAAKDGAAKGDAAKGAPARGRGAAPMSPGTGGANRAPRN